MNEIVIAVICAFIYFIVGFLAFVIEAYRSGYKKFDSEVSSLFFVCVVMGVVSFVIILILCLFEWFEEFMNKLLKDMNGDR